MKLHSVSGPLGGKTGGIWTHPIEPTSNVRIEHDRMIVAGPSHEPYIVHQDGTIEQWHRHPTHIDDD